jgi:hypothetical protein
MRKFLLVLFVSLPLVAQQPPVQSPLLDHLTGKWVAEGTIARHHMVDDIDAEWVLGHHYLRIHEVGRGDHKYEAYMFIAWNPAPKTYTMAFLDVYGGLTPASLAVATPKENDLRFVFKDEGGNVWFTNELIYDPKSDSWEWRLDNVEKDVAKEFGRVKIERLK